MEHEAAADIAEDTMRDDALMPPTDAEKEAKYGCAYCCAVGACPRCHGRAAITALTNELEIERGRNRVLGFQIRTLREGK
jgi:cytochrome c553